MMHSAPICLCPETSAVHSITHWHPNCPYYVRRLRRTPRKRDPETKAAKAEHRQDCQEMFRNRGRHAPPGRP